MTTASHRNAGHPDEEAVEMYVMGKLDAHAIDQFEDHVLLCEACQHRVQVSETYFLSMRSAMAKAPAPEPEHSTIRRLKDFFQMPTPVWAGAAAVIAIALAGVVGTRFFTRSPVPVAVALTATRGETASIAAHGPLDLNLDTRDLPSAESYRVQMVNADGKSVWEQNQVSSAAGHLSIHVAKHLASGQYFVRIYGSNAGTPREYAIQIR